MEKIVVILAGGKGTRMKSSDSNRSKVVYPILGKPMINYVLDSTKVLDADKTYVVVGFGGDVASKCVENDAEIVVQKEILGTGHALLQTYDKLKGKKGNTIVICADIPLITDKTIAALYHKHEKEDNDLTVVSTVLENPTGYGRIIRQKPSNQIIAIKEDSDCDEFESDINEVNSGIYVFKNEYLLKYIKEIKNDNKQHEYYLTDIVDLFYKNNLKIGSYIVEDPVEVYGINDRFQLSYAATVIRKRVNTSLMLSGVSIEDSKTTYISPDVVIGRDTTILPNVVILGKCVIGENNWIGPNAYIDDCVIGNNNHLSTVTLIRSKIGNHCTIESFCKVQEASIPDNAHVESLYKITK